jgi:hypothetical protein
MFRGVNRRDYARTNDEGDEGTDEPASSETSMFTLTNWKKLYKILICLFYVSLTIALLILCDMNFSKNDDDTSKQCLLRSTYREELLGNIGSNPFFSSSQIVRPPPKTRYEEQQGLVTHNPAQPSDISAFPTILMHPLRDAAYLPVDSAIDVPLSVMFQPALSATDLAGIGFGKDSQLVESDPFNHIIYKIKNLMSTTQPTLVKTSATSRFEDRREGTYHLLENGRIVAPDMQEVRNVSDFVTSLYYQGMHGASSGSILPNIHRCLVSSNDSDTFLEGMSDLQMKPTVRGMCDTTGQQSMVDISTNPMTSITLFSSIHIYYILLCIVWVTASFTVFHLPQFDRKSGDMGVYKSSLSMSDITAVAPIVWNIGLLIYSVVRSDVIPRNNIIGTIVLVLVVTFMQYMWSSTTEEKAEAMKQKSSYSSGNDRCSKENRGDRNGSEIYNGAQLTDYHGQENGLTSRAVTANAFRVNASNAPVFTNLYYADYQAIHKTVLHDNDDLRFMEYAAFTPLLFVLTLVSIHQNTPTHIVQILWVLLFLFHILCIPIANTAHTTVCKGVLVSVQALVLVTALYIYIVYAFEQAADFEKGSALLTFIAILVIIGEILFWVISMAAIFVSDASTGTLKRSMITGSYAVVNFFAKTFTILLITIATENNMWKGFACEVFDRLQKEILEVAV